MWVITHSKFTVENNQIKAWFYTDEPIHLYLLYTTYKPAREPVERNKQGTVTWCGWRYHFFRTECLDQQEPLDTLEHTFYIPMPVDAYQLWLFLAESCYYTLGGRTSPPMTIILRPRPCLWCDLTVALEPKPYPSYPPPQTIQTLVWWT